MMALLQPRASPCSLSSFTRHGQSLALQSPGNLTFTKPHSSVCKASWQELLGVVVFSAIPFTAVKAIANSTIRESLQRRLEERKKVAVENSSRFRAAAQNARKQR